MSESGHDTDQFTSPMDAPHMLVTPDLIDPRRSCILNPEGDKVLKILKTDNKIDSYGISREDFVHEASQIRSSNVWKTKKQLQGLRIPKKK